MIFGTMKRYRRREIAAGIGMWHTREKLPSVRWTSQKLSPITVRLMNFAATAAYVIFLNAGPA